jgi:hypothetical protein
MPSLHVSKCAYYSHTYKFVVAASQKYHKIVHWPAVISWFGCASNYNAETYESAHRWYVKRWLGKLQHTNEGSVKSLMKRTSVANLHGGSKILEISRLIADRQSTLYGLRGSAPNGVYKRVNLYKYNVWVNLGHFIIYSIMGSNARPAIGRIVSIQRKGIGHVCLRLTKFRRSSERGTIMAQWTNIWEIVPGNEGSVLLTTDDHDYDIDIFPMQPDFAHPGRFLSCTNMHIM